MLGLEACRDGVVGIGLSGRSRVIRRRSAGRAAGTRRLGEGGVDPRRPRPGTALDTRPARAFRRLRGAARARGQQLVEERAPVVMSARQHVFDPRPVAARATAIRNLRRSDGSAGPARDRVTSLRPRRSPGIRQPPRWRARSCGSGPAAARRSGGRSRAGRRSRRCCSLPSG